MDNYSFILYFYLKTGKKFDRMNKNGRSTTRSARCIMGEKKQTQLESLISDGLKYEVIEKRKAAERKALTRKNGLKIEDAKYLDGTKGQTRDIVAKKLGISGKHWDRIKYIYQHKELIDEQKYNNWIA